MVLDVFLRTIGKISPTKTVNQRIKVLQTRFIGSDRAGRETIHVQTQCDRCFKILENLRETETKFLK